MKVHKKVYKVPPEYIPGTPYPLWEHLCGLQAQEIATDNDAEVTCEECLKKSAARK